MAVTEQWEPVDVVVTRLELEEQRWLQRWVVQKQMVQL